MFFIIQNLFLQITDYQCIIILQKEDSYYFSIDLTTNETGVYYKDCSFVFILQTLKVLGNLQGAS